MTQRVAPILLPLLAVAVAGAADWPCMVGPNGDYTSPETGLADRFPDGGPAVVWRARVAPGYAGLAVAGGRVFTVSATAGTLSKDYPDARGQINRVSKQTTEIGITVYALDAVSGATAWTHAYTVAGVFPVTDWGRKSVEGPWANYFGPKATPTVDGGRVYVYDHVGVLTALRADTGERIWRRDVRADHGGMPPRFGYAAPPLVAGRLVVVPVFSETACLIALDKDSGEPAWTGGIIGGLGGTSTRWDGYSIPVLRTLGGEEQIVFFTGAGVQALRPADGATLWSRAIKSHTGEIVAPPLTDGTDVIVASHYISGAQCLRPAGGAVTEVWKTFDLKPRFANIAAAGDAVYGAHGSHYGAEFRCLNRADGARRWTTEFRAAPEQQTEHAQVLAADGKLILLTGYGDLVLAKADPEAYAELARGRLDDGSAACQWWTPPSLADGRLYARSTAGHVVCVDLRADSTLAP